MQKTFFVVFGGYLTVALSLVFLHVEVVLVKVGGPSIFARIFNLRWLCRSASTRHSASLPVLHDLVYRDGAREDEKQEYDDAKSYARFAHFALLFRTVCEVCAAAVAGCLVLLALAYACGVPHRYRNECTEPEDCEKEIESSVGVDVGEAPGSGPHWYHYLVDYCW